MRRTSILTLALAFALVAPTARAQQSRHSSIAGTVRDTTGASVGGADVHLVNPQQAMLRATQTDAGGQFRFDDVPAGTYEVRVTRTGFASRRLAARVVEGATADLAVTLEISQLSEDVTVTAEAGQVTDARSTAQPVNVINEREVIERAPEVVAQVVDEEPGVNLQRTSPSLSAVFVRGLTGRNVAIYVDGVRYTTSAQRGGVGTFFSLIEPSSLEAVEVLRGPNSSQ
ncbi:MAG: carboxypeptidase regulatory-like domain-containing protein, partial [Acidobacteria bacterium]|nr:carboxypeptidase regulatory-like domain-containing protein [Acidobacteriota bacterium]